MNLPALRHIALAAALCTGALAAHASGYAVRNLVSDGAVSAPNTDAHLKNTWGVAFNPFGFVWVANNHDGSSTLYDGNGLPQTLVVSVPPASGSGIGSPTGIIYNGSSDFVVSNGSLSGASRFLFASEDGAITGWAPNVDQAHALIAVVKPGAIYKGIAQAATGTANQLYATDFHNGRVDVYDKAFAPVAASGGFADPQIPKHYAPFGIQNIQGNLYVSYARQDADAEDDVAGKGKGFVNVFDPSGKLIKRLVAKEGLNAPWGMALAPANFGEWSNRLLVANFGDGTISAYDVATGAFVGQLSQSSGKPLKIPGLWGIQFGNGLQSQPTNTLFFSAGPNDESNGVYGSITAK